MRIRHKFKEHIASNYLVEVNLKTIKIDSIGISWIYKIFKKEK